MSTQPYRCEACDIETSFVAAGKYPEDDPKEATYGVTWRCPECGELSLDLCPTGPLAPTARSCLNCGKNRDPKKACPDCGMTEAETLAFLRIDDAKVRTLENAEAAFDQGLFRHGFAIVDSLLRKAPNVALWKAKGTQLQILKLPVAAAHAYEEALAIKPDPIVEIALAVARSDAGDTAAAEAIYDKLVDHDDAEVSGVAHANRGNLHEAKDDVDSAKRDYEAAIEREPGRIAHYQNLSRLFTKRKKWRDALEVVERGIAAMGEADATPLLLEKARAENELEDPEAAMATADGILEKEPEHTRALYHRAWAQGLLGRLDEAKETLETLLDIDPTNKDGKRALAKIEAARANAKKKPWWKIW